MTMYRCIMPIRGTDDLCRDIEAGTAREARDKARKAHGGRASDWRAVALRPMTPAKLRAFVARATGGTA